MRYFIVDVRDCFNLVRCYIEDVRIVLSSVIADLRAVSSVMPMYLLAEDEGNEEEIMRLLESLPPSVPVPVSSSSIASSTSLNSHTEDLTETESSHRVLLHSNNSTREPINCGNSSLACWGGHCFGKL